MRLSAAVWVSTNVAARAAISHAGLADATREHGDDRAAVAVL
jgi:hypothetical protein